MTHSVDEILDALRAAKSAGDIHRVADKYRSAVKAIHSNPDTRVRAVHIINLKAYLLEQFRNA